MKTNENKMGFIDRIKNSQYYKAIEDGFWRIWKNKSIWFWGIFVSSGTAFSFNQGFEEDKTVMSRDEAGQFFANYWQWILIGSVTLFILVIVFWLVSTVARAGVIKELDNKQNKKKHRLGFKKIWTVGQKDFKKVLRLDLLLLGITLSLILINLLMGWLAYFYQVNILSIILLGVIIFLSLIFLVFLTILKPFVLVYLLLSNLSIEKSFLKSWVAIRTKFKEFFKLILSFFVINFIKGAIFGVIIVIFVVSGFIIFPIFSNIYNESLQGIFILIGIISIILIVGALLMVGAFFTLWKMDILIWWVKMIDGIKVDKKTKKVLVKNKEEFVDVNEKIPAGVKA